MVLINKSELDPKKSQIWILPRTGLSVVNSGRNTFLGK